MQDLQLKQSQFGESVVPIIAILLINLHHIFEVLSENIKPIRHLLKNIVILYLLMLFLSYYQKESSSLNVKDYIETPHSPSAVYSEVIIMQNLNNAINEITGSTENHDSIPFNVFVEKAKSPITEYIKQHNGEQIERPSNNIDREMLGFIKKAGLIVQIFVMFLGSISEALRAVLSSVVFLLFIYISYKVVTHLLTKPFRPINDTSYLKLSEELKKHGINGKHVNSLWIYDWDATLDTLRRNHGIDNEVYKKVLRHYWHLKTIAEKAVLLNVQE